MSKSILGRKIGMSQVFIDDDVVGVTLVKTSPCTVLETGEDHKGQFVMVGCEDTKENRINKPQAKMFEKLGISYKKIIKKLPREQEREYKCKDSLEVDIFRIGEYVNVSGLSKGKGFQGGMKRWNWSGQPKTHGSKMHRRPGSIGASATPSRVFKGKHMPGQMGDKQITVQNLEIIDIDKENGLLTLKGAVPGARNTLYVIAEAQKKKGRLSPRGKKIEEELQKRQAEEEAKRQEEEAKRQEEEVKTEEEKKREEDVQQKE